MKTQLRKDSGMSLVTIISLGVVMGLWAYALAQLILPSFIKASKAKHANVLRSACEATLDWCSYSLTQPSSSVDDSTNNGTPVDTELTAAQLATLGIPSTLKARISVNNCLPPGGAGYTPATTSYVYDPNLNPAYTWRMVTATAWYTKNPAITKQVRVILKPIVKQEVAFKYAAFGKSGLTQTGNVTTDSVDTSSGSTSGTTQKAFGDVAAIGPIKLGTNSDIGGNVKAYHPPDITSPPSTVMVSGGKTIHGSVHSYGDISVGSVLNEPGAQPSGSADAQALNPFDMTGAPNIPATPTAPSTASNLGAISLSGNKTMTLAPGDYIVSSISITGNAQLKLSGNGPVNIYVQGAGASVSIGGNGISNPSNQSTNMRIWYAGTSDINISGNGNLTGVIYAPNASVVNNGNGAVTGAVVGNYINMKGNAPYHYDRALGTNPITIPTLDKYQTVSWQELQ